MIFGLCQAILLILDCYLQTADFNGMSATIVKKKHFFGPLVDKKMLIFLVENKNILNIFIKMLQSMILHTLVANKVRNPTYFEQFCSFYGSKVAILATRGTIFISFYARLLLIIQFYPIFMFEPSL